MNRILIFVIFLIVLGGCSSFSLDSMSNENALPVEDNNSEIYNEYILGSEKIVSTNSQTGIVTFIE